MVSPTAYASLDQVKKELLTASNQTNYDEELLDLLSSVDQHINMRMQKFTSLPVQSEIAIQLGEIEASMVAARFKLRRSAPNTYADYNNVLLATEQRLQHFLEQNFKTTFVAVGSEDLYRDNQPYNDGRPGPRNWYSEDGGSYQ